MKKARHTQAAHEPKGIDVQVLLDALRDNFSPQAVAAMAMYLQGPDTKSIDVNRELQWFAGELVKLVGGNATFTELANEVGL
jgi:hypothetical protein